MTPERWLRARRLFEAALDRDPGQRQQFLAAETGDDAAMLVYVEALLRADAGQTATPVDGEPGALLAARNLVGSTFADLRVVRQIGSGGMGTVYEAEQLRPQRRVALKTLTVRFPSERARRRFEDEVDILARLRHPGIAQVLAAGSERSGAAEVPWFSMELVEDPRTIDHHVRERDLGAREVAMLFQNVCEAVWYAHQRGVIHRDLKPANILVDRHGQPKVIDFGIARLAERDAASRYTRTGEILGTLAYMSPERLERAEAGDDTVSDVYALGVVLYELLAGRSPFALEHAAPARAIDMLRSTEPEPPSRLRNGVPAELDWVTMRAMARERDRRYATVGELAHDLARYLCDEPVLARPPSATYRLRKLAFRHRLLLGAAAVVFLAVSIGFVIAALGWRRVAAAELLARADAERASSAEHLAAHRATTLAEVNRFQQRILRGAYGSAKGQHTLLADVIDAAALDLHDNPPSEPFVEIGACNAIGASYLGLGDLEEAERHLRRAQTLIEQHGVDAAVRLDLAVASNLAVCYGLLGRQELAEQQLRASLADRIAVHGLRHVEVAVCQNNLATALIKQGESAEALELASCALETFTQWNATGDYAINARGAVAKALLELGRTAECERELTRARSLAEQHLAEGHPARLGIASLWAEFLCRSKRIDELMRVSEDVARAHERVSGATHPSTLQAWTLVAWGQAELGEHAAAEATLRRVIEAMESLGIRSGLDFVTAVHNLTAAVRRQGRVSEAEALARAARETARQSLPEGHPAHGTVLEQLGGCLRELGRFAEAEAALLEAHERLLRATSASDGRTQRVVGELVALYDACKQPDDAKRWRDQQSSRQ